MHERKQPRLTRSDKVLALLRNYPWVAVCVSGTLAATAYAAAAHSPLIEPTVIPPSAIDAGVPFLPWAAWPYATYALLLPALVLLASRLAGFERVIAAAVSTAFANAAVYLVWPTRLQARTEAPAGTLLALIQQLDTTLCAIPSGHVSLPMAITTAALVVSGDARGLAARRWRRVSACFLVWTIVLAASTLLTKQHYLVDAVSGAMFGLAVGIFVAARRFTSAAGATEQAHPSGSSPRLDSVAGGCV